MSARTSLCTHLPYVFFSASALSVFLVSCQSPGFNEPGNELQVIAGAQGIPSFDANDVSLMFPKASFLSLVPQFMTQQQFVQVLAEGDNKGPGPGSLIGFTPQQRTAGNWRVVSLRYDPCAPGAHAASNIAEQVGAPNQDTVCQGQVRLIAQPVVNGTEEDVTFHLLYALDKSDAARKVQLEGLARIKSASTSAGRATDGKALSIHPGLELPAVRTALGQFLSAHTSPGRLVSVAVMALAGGGPEPWVFYATRNINGTMTATPLPTVQGGLRFQALSFIGSERVVGKPSSQRTFKFRGLPELSRQAILGRSTDSIFSDPGFDDTAIVELNQQRLNVLHAIDNPETNHFFTMDCVSCHSSANLIMRRHIAATGAEKSRITEGAPTRFRVPRGISAYVNLRDLPTQESFQRPWTVRNFGYFAGRPTISFRTATETAEVVRDINIRMLGRNVAGPAATAQMTEQDYSSVENALWRCMHFSNSNLQACMTQVGARVSSTNPPATPPQNGGTTPPQPPQPDTSACTRFPPDSLKQSLQRNGSTLKLEHGPATNSSTFQAQVKRITPAEAAPLPGEVDDAKPSFFFSITHDATDSSKMALSFDTNFLTATGFRYDMNFTDRNFKVSLSWQCDRWVGTIGPDNANLRQ